MSSPLLDQPAAAGPNLVPFRALERLRTRWSADREALIAHALMAAIVVCVGYVVVEGAGGNSPLIPRSPGIGRYLHGIGTRLTFTSFLIALLVICACYAGVLRCARSVGARAAIGWIVALNVVAIAGPVILSQDIFSYLAYARLWVVHGVNPYLHGPDAIQGDPIVRYVGIQWKHVQTAYGPLFTLISAPFAALGLKGGVWGLKLLGLVSGLGVVAGVWKCAERLGRNPVAPALIVGMNPIFVIYGVATAHNDLLMAALMMLGVYLSLPPATGALDGTAQAAPAPALGRGAAIRDGWSAGAIVAATAVKATSALLLPFLVLARRRVEPIVGALLGLAVAGLVSYVAFGSHALDWVSVLRRQQSFVSADSFPNEVAHLLGKPGVFPVDRALLQAALVAFVLYLGWRTWRGYDWISASGWAMLAVACSTTWLLAWYILWSLPLAVIGRDRRVLVGVLAVQALYVLHQTSPLYSP